MTWQEPSRLGRIAVEKAKGIVSGELHAGSSLAGIYAEMGNPERAHRISLGAARYSETGRTGAGWPARSRGQRLSSRRLKGNTKTPKRSSKNRFKIFRCYHVPFEEAEALHYWGRALNASGEHGRANEKLDAAIEIYRRCGAGERWVERVEADRPPSPARTEKVEPTSGRPKPSGFPDRRRLLDHRV